MKRTTKFLSAAASLVVAANANAIVINAENDGSVLASNIAGTGVTISNISYSGADGASGTFTDGLSSGIGIESGIIMSSGSAAGAAGPNDSTGETTANGLPGYAPLDALAGASTFDATVLSFDFEFDGGVGGDLFFNMVFGSEEYNEFVNAGFNDTFAFFLDGVNIATLPDASPISIDNINLGSNSGLFNDNTGGANDIEFDGFTNVLQISATGLAAGLHTMEFAIADAGDSVLDSWIMIEASSFSNTPGTSVSEPGTLALLGLGLAGIGFTRRKHS